MAFRKDRRLQKIYKNLKNRPVTMPWPPKAAILCQSDTPKYHSINLLLSISSFANI